MIPILFEIGPIKVHSFGLMLGIGFILGSYILSRELKRKGLDPNLASAITIIALVFGISGAKILYLIENWDAFLARPVDMTFSAGGLTWYGGFVLGMTAISIYIKRKKIRFLKIWDGLGVALILAYGVARLGCHFAGDGDYGTPTHLPWGTIYAQGVAKPTEMLREYFDTHPEERKALAFDSLSVIPAGRDRMGHMYSRFDEVTPLHPTPVYELLMGIVGFLFLWRIRTTPRPDGALFMIYLMLATAFRFAVEFLRLQPKLLFGLSEAQLISIALFVVGLLGTIYFARKTAPQPAPHQ